MKYFSFCILILCLMLFGEPTLLLHDPDIYEQTVIFEYGGDLWRASIKGRYAQRLTAHDGYETHPEFSPDGQWIAYSGEYNTDDYDVYIMPAKGGAPKRLTYYPADDLVVGWTPDGKYILFASSRGDWKKRRLFKISIEGGLPEQIPLFAGYEADYSPDGNMIVFNYRGVRLPWKGYAGGRTTDIWLYDAKKDTTYKIISWQGTEINPQWCNDKIYFIADKHGRMNIYNYDLSNKETKQVTLHDDFDVQSINKDKTSLVYACAGLIHVVDMETDKIDTLSIEVPDDRRFLYPKYESVSHLINSGYLSPTGKRVVISGRGDIFTVPKEQGAVVNITKSPGIREKYPTWSPDAKWLAFVSDETDENEIYIAEPSNTGKQIRITFDGDCYRYQPEWSPDSKKLLYADSKYRLFYVDVEDRKPVLVDTSSMSGFSSYKWSPDNKWIAYVKLSDNLFGSVYLYSVDNRKIHQVTGNFFDEDDVCFDKSGEYLYFISSRTFDPIMGDFSEIDIFPKTGNICVIPLSQETPSPFLPESDEESIEENDGADDKEDDMLTIDFENIDQRVLTIPVPAGNYSQLSGADNKVLYLERVSLDIRERKYNLHFYDLKEKEDFVLIKNIDGYNLSSDGEVVLYKSGETYGIIDLMDKKYTVGDGKITTEDIEVKIDRRAELNELFADAWRLQRDFYYDPKMHGLDWLKLRAKYSKFLPHIADREDLTRIISWLFSELGGSHAYVWSPKDQVKKVSMGLLGAELELDKASGFYKFKKILKGETWKDDRRAPLTEPGSTIHKGEYLISINGEIVRYPDNPYEFLENTLDKQVTISVTSAPDIAAAREVEIKPISFINERKLYYLDWVENNKKLVEQATNGRIGYIHVPNTAIWGLEEFGKYFFSQAGKKGLIIDVRFNSGGWSPYVFVNYLQRKPLGYFIRRTGKPVTDPFAEFSERLVCLMNEFSGSGGDMFPYYFRKLELGPLIGNTTWGGLIATAGRRLMDGGGVATPVSRFRNMAGAWEIENEGVVPDILVDDHPDKLRKGIDAQLDKAIEVIIKEE